MPTVNLTLELREEHSRVFSSSKRFRVLVAGRRWGKTTLAVWSLIVHACSGRDRRCYYVAPTYAQAKRIAWSVLKGLLSREACLQIREQDLIVELRNGSMIQLHGADKPDRLRGVSLDMIVLDEYASMRPETWTSVARPALADNMGRALFIGTPFGRNHLYDLFIEAKFRKDWESFHFTTAQGGYVSEDEVLAASHDMSPIEYAREFCASFEDSGMRVYSCFDREKNVAEIDPYPGLPLLIGMDFNISPMTAVIAQRIARECHVVDEIILQNSNTTEMMQEVNRRYRGWQGIVHPDPSASSRKTSALAGETDLTIIRRSGWEVYKNSPQKVVDRINSVNAMLLNAQGARRLIISRRCPHLIKALDSLMYKPETKFPDKRSGFDHVTDALGYMVSAVFPIVPINTIGIYDALL
jgi:Terminase large subunit, T4likevirus-type, N-terminal